MHPPPKKNNNLRIEKRRKNTLKNKKMLFKKPHPKQTLLRIYLHKLINKKLCNHY